MSTITTILATDKVGDSRSDINTNFSNLNTDKLENIAEDLTPQLGADLDMNGKDIIGQAGGVQIEGKALPTDLTPGYSFQADTTTGIGFKSSGSAVTLISAGSKIMEVDTAQVDILTVDLDLNGNNIVGVNLVDGIDIATDVAANTLKVTNATHTGDVTGSGALTIADGAVTYAKMQDVSATDRLLGRDTAGAGDVEEITPAAARTMLNVEDGADVTDETNVKSALNGATITGATVAGTDKVLIQDVDDSDNLKTVTAQSVADLAATPPGGADTQVQFNDGGSAFGGDAGLTYNKSTDVLTAGRVDMTAVAAATVAATDKVLIQDVDAADVTKTVTAQSIADLTDTSGFVVGPASAVDDGVVTFDGTTGKLVQDSGATIAAGEAGGSLLNLNTYTSDPASPQNGDIWILNSAGVFLKARVAGTTYSVELG